VTTARLAAHAAPSPFAVSGRSGQRPVCLPQELADGIPAGAEQPRRFGVIAARDFQGLPDGFRFEPADVQAREWRTAGLPLGHLYRLVEDVGCNCALASDAA